MNIERVINGFKKFLDHGFYSNMTSWQKFGAIFVLEMLDATVISSNKIEEFVMSNSFLRTILITDNEGNVDIDRIYSSMKKAIQRVGKIEVAIPLYDKFVFTESDIDCLYNCIIGG